MKSIAELKALQDTPVVAADKQGMVTYINASFEQAYGWTASDLMGKPLSTIIPKSLHDAHNFGFSRFLVSEKPTLLGKPLSLKVVTKAGEEKDAEHCIIAEKINGEWAFAATISLK